MSCVFGNLEFLSFVSKDQEAGSSLCQKEASFLWTGFFSGEDEIISHGLFEKNNVAVACIAKARAGDARQPLLRCFNVAGSLETDSPPAGSEI